MYNPVEITNKNRIKNIDEKAETFSQCPKLLPLTNPCWDISLD